MIQQSMWGTFFSGVALLGILFIPVALLSIPEIKSFTRAVLRPPPPWRLECGHYAELRERLRPGTERWCAQCQCWREVAR